jgi:hypothetical protein
MLAIALSLTHVRVSVSSQNVAKFEGHVGHITSLSFSENGYFLATAAADGIKLWDLRKLKNFKTIEGAVGGVCFDYSGLYLAAAGAEAAVYGVKQEWAPVKILSDIPKKVRRGVASSGLVPVLLTWLRSHFWLCPENGLVVCERGAA